MNSATMAVLVIVLFALVIVAVVQVFRQKIKAKVKGPAGMSLEVDASNAPPVPVAAVRVEDIKSRSGGLVAEDATGRGVDVKKVEVERDVRVTSSPPKDAPKA
jgi:hypothetical protein